MLTNATGADESLRSQLRVASFRASEAARSGRDSAAYFLGVTPPYIDVAFGCILFVILNALCREVTFLTTPSPAADAAASRLLAIALFSAVQQCIGVPLAEWLRVREDTGRVDASPLFQSGSPLAGVIFAFCFAVPVATAAQLVGVPWVPEARPFPDASASFLKILVAPATEEMFFRAWLLTAFERAGGSDMAALIASSALFALFNVPFSAILDGSRSSELLVFEALGAYLAWLYQRSGRSLPLVVVTHVTCNLLVTALRAAQVDSKLPF